MTNMKHKSVDAKRQRRTRHKRALEPIVKRFGCTQMQAASYVTSVLSDNESLQKKVQDRDSLILILQEEIKHLKDEMKKKEKP